MTVRFYYSPSFGPTSLSRRQWGPSRRRHQTGTFLAIQAAPAVAVADGGRDWTNSTQDVTLTFPRAMTDAALSLAGSATGWSVSLNGVAQTTTYRSGSGSASWTLRIPALVKYGDTLTIAYNRDTGGTKDPESNKLASFTGLAVTNSLTRRLRFTLKGSDNAVVANESVKVAVLEYDSATVANASWMSRSDKATVTTDSAGLVDTPYTGTAAVGTGIYAAIIRASESFVWNDVVS